MQFMLIASPGERETDRQLEAACAARGLPFTKLTPGAANGVNLGEPGRRRLIYRTGVSTACILLEQLLYRAGDAALHDPFFHYGNQPLIFQRAGLPRPRTVYVPDPDPAALARQVQGLGGFPVVVKLGGAEGGAGVSLAHDLDALVAALGEARSYASLEAYFPHVRSWRVTVLNGRVLAATARSAGTGDFRTNGPGSGPVEAGPAPEKAGEITLRAARALKLEFGGADILEGADGSLCISEFNFPCYFADQYEQTGVDIAGAIVDRLIDAPPHPTAGRWTD